MLVEIKRWWGTIGFLFDILAVQKLCELHGVELHETAKIDKEIYIYSWSYGAHVSYCMNKYKRPKLSPEKVRVFIDKKINKSEWEELVKAMTASRGKEGEVEQKKK